MMQTLEAVYDGAVLRPDVAVPLPPNTRVRLTLETIPSPAPKEQASFLRTARSLRLTGPSDWSETLDHGRLS